MLHLVLRTDDFQYPLLRVSCLLKQFLNSDLALKMVGLAGQALKKHMVHLWWSSQAAVALQQLLLAQSVEVVLLQPVKRIWCSECTGLGHTGEWKGMEEYKYEQKGHFNEIK